MIDVLLIEPDKLLAQIYQKALRAGGLSVHWQSQAQAGIAVIDSQKPKVVVLELQLKGHNGVEFLYELRSHVDWSDTKVIIHSLVPEGDLNLGKILQEQLGVSSYLYKPKTSLAELTAAVKDLIK